MPRAEIDPPARKKPPMFWWLLANVLAIAFAITAWVVCLNLFRDPTHPTSYDLMLKVGRIEPLKSFTRFDLPIPRSERTPEDLETEYQPYGGEDLEALNHELMRAYLTNFNRARYLTYVKGSYRILEVRTLTPDDFLSPGIAVRAQAMVVRDQVTDPIPYPVFIECLFPTEEKTGATFAVGDTLTLDKTPDFAALIHVGKTGYEDHSAIFLTVVPLYARNYVSPGGPAFRIKPPEKAHVAADLPVFNKSL